MRRDFRYHASPTEELLRVQKAHNQRLADESAKADVARRVRLTPDERQIEDLQRRVAYLEGIIAHMVEILEGEQ